MTIVAIDRSQAAAWDAYAAGSPQASFYHRYGWRDINTAALDHHCVYLAAIEDGRITGIFPFVQVKSLLFGNLGCSMPFVNYGGPCADTPAIEDALIEEARRLAAQLGIGALEIRSRRHLGEALPCSTRKVSMSVRLDKDPDVLWNAFKTGHRQEIRKGYKKGFVARFGGEELLDPFYEVMCESWRNLGTPIYGRRYFETILQTFPGATRLCVVFQGDEPAATAFDGLHRDTVEGMWLGIKSAYRSQHIGYVLYWELIKDACERGFADFHLGRSTADSGGESFKKKWNASTTQLYWHYLLQPGRAMPALNVDNPRYEQAIAAWRRLPIPVTRWLGPSLARRIP
jgi:FemAB-related protein (PEP-CTERM system-associated)